MRALLGSIPESGYLASRATRSGAAEDVDVVEVVQEALEERVPILDDRRLDTLEDLTVDTFRVVLGLEHERGNRPEEHGLPHTLRSVRAEVARDLTATHREARENGVDLILFAPVFEKRIGEDVVNEGVGLKRLREA